MSGRALIIAIDGPSGAGKGTVARTLAARLRYRHIDTGAMYRAVAWLATREGVDLTDGPAVAAVARRATFGLEGGVHIDGHDVTAAIRTAAMDTAAATVARLPEVRRELVERQRAYGGGGGVVMEGRDIGTVVFPAADLKLYLDATPEERARRRASDAAHASGRDASGLDSVARALEARDHADRTRAISPLAVAPDAIYIDTTATPIDEVVARALSAVAETLARVAT